MRYTKMKTNQAFLLVCAVCQALLLYSCLFEMGGGLESVASGGFAPKLLQQTWKTGEKVNAALYPC